MPGYKFGEPVQQLVWDSIVWAWARLVVESLSQVQLFATPWTAAHQASRSFTISQSLLNLTSMELLMPSNHLILCCPLLLLPSIFPSISVFSNESALRIRWPKYCSFSFSISPSNEYSGLISFRIDWFDLLAVQGTLKSLLQDHSSGRSPGEGNLLPTPVFLPGEFHGQRRLVGYGPWDRKELDTTERLNWTELTEGRSYGLQYFCLENSMDRGDWWATVHRVTQSWTQLRD